MVLRKTFWISLAVMVFCTAFSGLAAENPVKEEEKEKSELALLMGEIDKHYKVLEKLSTYFSFEEVEKEWQVGLLRQTCADCHKHLDIHIGAGKHNMKK